MFDWCYQGFHDLCRREYQVFTVDPKTNKVILTGEVKTCQCKKRGCKCYIKPAERTKKRRAPRRK